MKLVLAKLGYRSRLDFDKWVYGRLSQKNTHGLETTGASGILRSAYILQVPITTVSQVSR